MTYDELYEHITKYVAMPHTTITEHDQRRACLILGTVMEFLLDCEIEGTNPYTIDMTDFIHEKIDEYEAIK
jgi:hypothetical protein